MLIKDKDFDTIFCEKPPSLGVVTRQSAQKQHFVDELSKKLKTSDQDLIPIRQGCCDYTLFDKIDDENEK